MQTLPYRTHKGSPHGLMFMKNEAPNEAMSFGRRVIMPAVQFRKFMPKITEAVPTACAEEHLIKTLYSPLIWPPSLLCSVLVCLQYNSEASSLMLVI